MSKLKKGSDELVAAILMVVFGILLCIFRSSLIGVLFTIIGALLIILGIYDIIKFKAITKGIIEAVVGVVIIVFGWWLFQVAIVVLGAAAIVYGVMYLVNNIKNIKSSGGTSKALMIIQPILLIAFGVILVIAPWVMVDIMNILFIIAGVVLIFDGVMSAYYYLSSK
ncbi:MAG: DUF308 domain-containing protein [Bacilli bacterium]|nr:DUF308 domain-containing protein [Bacilli bacterium]MDD4065536.1 DUF308 domain-containing protein [Bacilli bacterium]